MGGDSIDFKCFEEAKRLSWLRSIDMAGESFFNKTLVTDGVELMFSEHNLLGLPKISCYFYALLSRDDTESSMSTNKW